MLSGIQGSSRSVTTRSVGDGLAAPIMCAWRHWDLLARLVRRDIEARFRGSLLGMFWAGAAPLVRLGAYTLVIGLLVRPQWQGEVRDPVLIAFIYFSGLVVFDFFMECVGAAPTLMRDNPSFIKKVVFPVEILAWSVLGHGVFRLLVGFALLAVAYVALKGLPPVGVVLIPLLVAPLALMILGLIWIISALATYVRDIGHVVHAFLPVLMFVSPVFFPLSALPASAQALLLINPTTFPLEQIRLILFGAPFEAWLGLGVYCIAAGAVASFGYRIFMHLRPGFADVI